MIHFFSACTDLASFFCAQYFTIFSAVCMFHTHHKNDNNRATKPPAMQCSSVLNESNLAGKTVVDVVVMAE